MKRRIIIIIIFILSSIPFDAISQWTHQVVSTDSNITALKSSKYGYLYYGNASGTFGYFDGLKFEPLYQFDGSISKIKLIDDRIYVGTTKGLYLYDDHKTLLQTPTHFQIVDFTKDLSTIITSEGCYVKRGNDFFPESTGFYGVNKITNGSFYFNDTYAIINHQIFQKDKSEWKKRSIHPYDSHAIYDNDQWILVLDSLLITMDKTGQEFTRNASSLFTNSQLLKTKNHLLFTQQNHLYEIELNTFNISEIEIADIQSIHAIEEDDWGQIWISGNSGLARLTPPKVIEELPKLELSSIEFNGESISKNEIDIKGDEGSILLIKIRGTYLPNPQALFYQYSIDGNRKWSKKTKEETIIINQFNAGKNTVQIRAGVDGKYYTYSQAITVNKKNKENISFWLLPFGLGMGILAAGIVFQYRYEKLKEKISIERKILDQEKKLFEFSQKAMQLQMNPHFLFNALQSIQGLIVTGQNDAARKYLSAFSSLMRSLLNQSRTSSISIQKEVEYLNHYLSLEQMANNHAFDFNFEVEDSIKDQSIPSMIIQPFVENAIIHGIKPMKKKGKIDIRFKDNKTHILCEVEDNGIGFNQDHKDNKHESVAIELTCFRLKSLLPLNIDPVIYHHLNTGTLVKIHLPK